MKWLGLLVAVSGLLVGLVGALVGGLVPAAFSGAPDLPWATFSDPGMREAYLGSQFAFCPSRDGVKEVYVAGFAVEERLWVLFYAPETGELLVVYDPERSTPNNQATWMFGRGRVDLETPGAHDRIPSLTWEPYDALKHEDFCGILYPLQA